MCLSACVFKRVFMCVCFIVMPRTSGPVPCQVVPSQLAVAHALFCAVLCIQPTTHIVVKSLSLVLPPLSPLSVCVCVCVFYDCDLDVGRKLETRVGQ